MKNAEIIPSRAGLYNAEPPVDTAGPVGIRRQVAGAYWEYVMHRKHTQILGYSAAALLAALGAIGCAARDSEPPWPEPRALGRDIHAFRPVDDSVATPLVAEESAGTLTLRGALVLALARNPALSATSWTVRAAEAKTLQEGLPPNPEVRVGMDDFGGTGEFEGTRESRQDIRLSQVIELGGKASSRRRAARLEAALCGWDYETARLDVFTETTKAFVAVLAAQQRVAAAQEMHDFVDQNLTLVSKQAQGGVGVYLDNEEALIERGGSRIELDRARHALAAARGVLASYWDEVTPKFHEAIGDLENLSPTSIPPCEQLLARLESNHDVSRWDTETRMRQAVLEREKADGIPDVRVLLGARRREQTGDYGFSSALEISLPIFDRNQGSIREARAELTGATYERRAAIMDASAALRLAHQSLSASQWEANLLNNDVIPAARRAVDMTRDALQWGGATAMQLLKARRTLFRVQIRQIDALEAFHMSLADVERLTGQPIGDFAPSDGSDVPLLREPHEGTLKRQ
jgi:cobalt-zinc-cadmium efflux system outer membrane protein